MGCGSGGFLAYLRDRGWQAHGVEITPQAVTYAQQVLGLDVVLGDIFDAHYPDNHFDLVTLWNVFEHLHDPAAALDEIRRILKPEGGLVLAVPNLESWDARLFGPAWVGYDVPRHLYTFTPTTLKMLLSRQGFEWLDMHCLFGTHQAYVNSAQFALTARYPGGNPGWARLLLRLASSRGIRLAAMPIFGIVSALGKGTVMTVFAKPV